MELEADFSASSAKIKVLQSVDVNAEIQNDGMNEYYESLQEAETLESVQLSKNCKRRLMSQICQTKHSDVLHIQITGKSTKTPRERRTPN